MKFGLVYFKNTNNLGDDILSYASERFLPNKCADYLIDREKLDVFIPKTEEKIACILNGWYIHDETAFVPSPYIYPLYIGTHLASAELFGDSYIKYSADYLKKYSPIGCRDYYTSEKLTKLSIDNYFSGCLTMTLNQFDDVDKKKVIVLVDVPAEIESYVKKFYSDTEYEVKIVSHLMENIPDYDWEHRRKTVEEFLKLYQSACLVITTRLHCALPSVALGTKVCMVRLDTDDFDRRIGSFSTIFSGYYHADAILNGSVNDYFLSPCNNADISELRNKLIDNCKEFIYKAENDELDFNNEELISVDAYKKEYVNRTQYIKDVFMNLKEEYKKMCIQQNNYEEILSLRKQNKELIELLQKSREVIESLTR